MLDDEQTLRPGDMVQLGKRVMWPGVVRRLGKGTFVPAGAVGRLERNGIHWAIKFEAYPNDPEWPCLIGFYPSQLPPWIMPLGSIPVSETPMEQLSDRQLLQITWDM